MTHQPSHFSQTRYRQDIDGLRAVAVLAVVAFHAFPSWVRGGFIGVDIFFVISGYLISKNIFESFDQGTFSVSTFYFRRIKRIFPALLLVLITFLTFGWFALLADEYRQLGRHIAASAGFISNFLLWSEAGYFDNSVDTKPLLHLWSLGIEEQFYIMWPLLLLFARNRKFNIVTVTVVIAIVSFILNLKGVKEDIVATFYSPQSRFWELLVGSLLAWATLNKKELLRNSKNTIDAFLFRIIYSPTKENDGKTLSNTLSSVGLLFCLFGFWQIHKEVSFPGKWALFPVLGAALIIAAGPDAWVNRRVLSNKVAVWFGLISFPLYLWHWPLLSFARIVGAEPPSVGLRLVIIAFSVLLAWLTYKFVERPIRFGRQEKTIAACLVVLMILVGLIGYTVDKRNGLVFRTIAQQAQEFDFQSEIEGYGTCDIEELRTNGVKLNYCLLSNSKKPNSVIIGDSHAEDKFHGLVALDKQNNWMLIGNSSCPPVLDISVEADQKGCEEKFKVIIDYLVQNRNIQNVALSFYGNYFKTDMYAADHVRDKGGPSTVKISSSTIKADRKGLFYEGLNATVKKLIDSGKSVYLFIDIPELPFLPKDCFRAPFKQCEISRTEAMERQTELRNIVIRLKSSNPHLQIFDPIDLLCDEATCSYKQNGVIFYKDSHHLTKAGSHLFAERFIMIRQ